MKLMFIIVILLIPFAYSAELTITKSAENPGNITSDSEIKMLLNVSNPFAVDLPVKIESRDVAGESGFDIQCYEFTIPKEPNVTLQLSTFQALAGVYVMPSAKVTYTNPETNEEVTVESNEYTLEVGIGQQTATTKVTTIYQCDGQQIQYSSTQSSTMGAQEPQTQEQQEEQEQMKQDMQHQMDGKLQNNQMNQDSSALKQEMQKQVQEQQQMEQEFDKNVQENQDFQEMKQQLEEQGFQEIDKNLNPESNNTGDFDYEFEDGQGNKANINGNMQDGQMQNLEQTSAQEASKLQEQLEKNKQYQEYKKELEELGFNQTEFKYTENGNMTKLVQEFANKQGITAQVTAKYENQTITDVNLDANKKKNLWWLLLFPLVLLAVLLFRKKDPVLLKTKVELFDYRVEAQKMLEKAHKLFRDGQYKDAYGLASEALRMFCSHDNERGEELTATETVRVLKQNKKPYVDVQKCLNLCGLVEFARYKPSKKDFDKILRLARKTLDPASS